MKSNNSKNLEDMLKTLKSVSLSEAEKASMKDNLIVFMDSDVRNADKPRLKNQSQLLTLLLNFRFMPIALGVLMLLGGSGVSLAAEGALPGEILYKVKGFNEQARIALALSGEAKAEYESRFASRRLEEAEKLLAVGALSAENKADLEARFEAHAEKVKTRVEKMKANKNFEAAAEISGDFESSMNAHGRILKFLLEAEAEGEETGLISAKVKLKSEAAKDLRQSAQVEISAQANVDLEIPVRNKLASVKHKIEEVKNFIEKKKDSIRAEILVEVNAKIALAETKMAEAEAKIEAGSFKEAFISLQDTHRMAMEAKILASASSKVEGEIERGEEERENRKEPLKRNLDNLPTTVPVEVREKIEARIEARTESKIDAKINPENRNNGLDVDAKVKANINLGL